MTNKADPTMGPEILDIVDEQGQVIGSAPRSDCHGNPALLHQVVHVHVFNPQGALFLQKRSATKDIQPLKWDTSIGGHVEQGETLTQALIRESREELGLTDLAFKPLFQYIHSNDIESELVYSYYIITDATPQLNLTEIDQGKFWMLAEIQASLGKNVFTPNFEAEFDMLLQKLPL